MVVTWCIVAFLPSENYKSDARIKLNKAGFTLAIREIMQLNVLEASLV